jgi:hypothetical protein
MVSAGAVVLTLSFPGSRGLAAPPRDSEPETRSWDRKLDPFLRHIALGSEKHQGPIEEKLPARSREVMHALPPFVRAERDADDPIVYVKARLQPMRDEVATAPRSAAAPGEGRSRAGCRRSE